MHFNYMPTRAIQPVLIIRTAITEIFHNYQPVQPIQQDGPPALGSIHPLTVGDSTGPPALLSEQEMQVSLRARFITPAPE
jgi:hypothetical protein